MEALGRPGEYKVTIQCPGMATSNLSLLPGKKDGEVLMIKNNGKVEAYQVRIILFPVATDVY